MRRVHIISALITASSIGCASPADRVVTRAPDSTIVTATTAAASAGTSIPSTAPVTTAPPVPTALPNAETKPPPTVPATTTTYPIGPPPPPVTSPTQSPPPTTNANVTRVVDLAKPLQPQLVGVEYQDNRDPNGFAQLGSVGLPKGWRINGGAVVSDRVLAVTGSRWMPAGEQSADPYEPNIFLLVERLTGTDAAQVGNVYVIRDALLGSVTAAITPDKCSFYNDLPVIRFADRTHPRGYRVFAIDLAQMRFVEKDATCSDKLKVGV